MEPNTLHTCGATLARINGRTLANNLKQMSGGHPFGSFSSTNWIEVCPQCHSAWLAIDTQKSLPLLCADEVMRTAHDIDMATGTFHTEIIDFGVFRFSYAALESAIHLQLLEFNTKETELFGESLGLSLTEKQVEEFSERVCLWGGGARVWANIKRRNPGTLSRQLIAWLKIARKDGVSDEVALAGGTAIPGLAVSFASKHLRMLRPDRFAVLDAVLSDGLGFALNPKGYKLFMHFLRTLREELHQSRGFPYNVATLEAGLFLLVRQNVRSKDELN